MLYRVNFEPRQTRGREDDGENDVLDDIDDVQREGDKQKCFQGLKLISYQDSMVRVNTCLIIYPFPPRCSIRQIGENPERDCGTIP